MRNNYRIEQISGLDSIPSESWNRLTNDENPFLKHEYLFGLEKSTCLKDHGWIPGHIVAYFDDLLVGALPLYFRTNSYGEFVFDWSWADAYERAGGNYYPKLVSAIPFAPVIGPRLLIDQSCKSVDEVKRLLLEHVISIGESAEISSYHCLFTDSCDHDVFSKFKLLQRTTCQFHWFNEGYRDFQDFTGSLMSKKRKQIKKERKQIIDNNIEIEVLTGDQINDEQWQAFYSFYCSTFERRLGSPRLTLAFFHTLSEKMPSNTLLILAKHQKTYVAGAYAMVGHNTVYGRHWGRSEHFPFLHFELCYYQTIEYCINNKLSKVDAGVQGEHKMNRGFQPVRASSYHWIKHPQFKHAIEEYLTNESREMNCYFDNLNEHLPFKATGP